MTKPLIVIHNVETDEIIEREMTSEEFKIYEIEQQAEADRKSAKTQAEADKAALLAKLGITADEAKLLFS
jgi:uncharacterized membrane protein YqiK